VLALRIFQFSFAPTKTYEIRAVHEWRFCKSVKKKGELTAANSFGRRDSSIFVIYRQDFYPDRIAYDLNSFQNQGHADLIKSYLALGDDSGAEAAVEKLMADFSWSSYIARAIHDTAWEYRKLANYSRANELDQYVIDRWPEDVQAMWAKMDMAKTDIALGDYAAADKTVDILIADFNNHPEMPTAIFMLGEQYYNKAFTYENQGQTAEAKSHFQKAITIWQRIINELPQSSITPQAYYFAARCYETLGEYDYAANYFQTVIDNWPDYQFCDVAHFLLARCFENLANSGSIPKNEVAVMI